MDTRRKVEKGRMEFCEIIDIGGAGSGIFVAHANPTGIFKQRIHREWAIRIGISFGSAA